jgi:NAD(P)-dependent dehydrogenase (short-subunit alcohol dehydrogenase family)
LAVVTGGGSGMGRELVVQLASEGCSVAMCDVNDTSLKETAELAAAAAPSSDVRITTHLCDVSDPDAVDVFRDEVIAQHDTDHINLLFSNAGIAGGGSFINADRAEWERCFGVCWGGVYNCARSFVPLVVASDDGYVINTSSVNGFWASLGPGIPHTAYSSAKFAVKGFTEALMEDFRVNAPHVKAAVVMPGHIGTNIIDNTRILQGTDPDNMTAEELADVRTMMAQRGIPADSIADADLQQMVKMMGQIFRDNAPTSAAEAATVILDGVKAEKWRILVGDDAFKLDEAVRANPEGAYGPDGVTLGTINF